MGSNGVKALWGCYFVDIWQSFRQWNTFLSEVCYNPDTFEITSHYEEYILKANCTMCCCFVRPVIVLSLGAAWGVSASDSANALSSSQEPSIPTNQKDSEIIFQFLVTWVSSLLCGNNSAILHLVNVLYCDLYCVRLGESMAENKQFGYLYLYDCTARTPFDHFWRVIIAGTWTCSQILQAKNQQVREWNIGFECLSFW